jgi:hypothetical protein
MQLIHRFDTETAARLMRGRKTVLVAGQRLAPAHQTAQTCRELGLDVEAVEGRYDALAAIADDPAGYDALVLDSNDADGIAAVRVSVRLLQSIAPQVVPVLLASDSPVPLPDWPKDRQGIRDLSSAETQ